MNLEGKSQRIINNMKKQGKVSFCNFEDEKYARDIKYVKDNFSQELKEKGVIISLFEAEYPVKIN